MIDDNLNEYNPNYVNNSPKDNSLNFYLFI